MSIKYHKQAEKMGLSNRITLCVEEMSELTKALCKWKRYNSNDPTLRDNIYNIGSNIVEELADVELLLEQIKYLLGAKNQVEQIKEEKFIRTERMLAQKEGITNGKT